MSGTQNKSDPLKSPSLTEKQAEILSYIEAEIAESGCPPTFRQIAKHFGYKAVGTVEDHVKALIRKGVLLKESGVACGIRLAHHSSPFSIPILGSVPAGKPIEAIESALGSLPVSSTRCRGGEHFALQVRGESMRDAGILDGDYVVVRKQITAEDGDIVVALIDGEATVKTLEKRKGRIRLLPANPAFEPIELRSDRQNSIQGKVISVQRFY